MGKSPLIVSAQTKYDRTLKLNLQSARRKLNNVDHPPIVN